MKEHDRAGFYLEGGLSSKSLVKKPLEAQQRITKLLK